MMKKHTTTILILMILAVFLAGCQADDAVVIDSPIEDELGGTSVPEVALTLQADADLTAERVSVILTQDAQATARNPVVMPTEISGTPIPAENLLSSRRGLCPRPEGYTTHVRTGFCISAPEDWFVSNIDGNVAAGLDTTPGQAIALEPGWTERASDCQLMIYITPKNDPYEHLESRHEAISRRSDISNITGIEIMALGDLLLPGFIWETESGESGAVYADMIGLNRLVHIAHQGTDCPRELLLPAIDTLYFE